MGKKRGKVTTEHTEQIKVEDAPDELKPFAEIDDLKGMVFLDYGETPRISDLGITKTLVQDPDTSRDAAVRSVLSDESIIPSESFREVLQENYNDYYEPVSKDNPQWVINSWTREANKQLKRQQKEEEKQAEKEARPRNGDLWDEKYQKKFIDNYLDNKERKRLDQHATGGLSAAIGTDAVLETTARLAADRKQKEAETVCRMNDALEYLSKVQFEYLTRGATMACSSGATWRKLNLPWSHGVYYGEEGPVINAKDGQVGDRYNISNFGLCGGCNPPQETIVVEDMVVTDENGRFLASKEKDTVRRGHKCIPEVISPGWQNTYKKTRVGFLGDEAVSTKSFLVCIHGGIIYPINSGQHSDMIILTENDAELKSTFDQLSSKYLALKDEQAELMDKGVMYGEEQRLYDVMIEKNECKEKMESVMNRARGDSYQGEYDDIPPQRKELMEYMLRTQGEVVYGENADVSSVKSDYYRYRRSFGVTSDSEYNNDDANFIPGSDEYTDWRAYQMENQKKKAASADFKDWERDVESRGYNRLNEFEKEEYDRAKKKYGK